MKPNILIFDEPTSDLDPEGTMEIISAIKKLAIEENKAIILIEHKLQDLIEIIDRIYIMNKGEIVVNGSPSHIFSKYLPKIYELGINIPVKYASKNSVVHSGNIPIKENRILSIENLYFKYSEDYVLKDISLCSQAGDFIALLGRNGSGKTSLVQNITGLLRPESGNIFLQGNDLRKRKIQKIARKIGYLFQNPSHQIFLNTVYDELAFGLKNFKIKKEEIETKILKMAKKLEISSLLDKPTYTLSRGQSQRIALASILLLEPKLLILDEPTTGQDYRNRRQIMEVTQQLNEQGITIILITHDIDLAYEYARRIIIMNNGEILADGLPNLIFENKEILTKAGLRRPKILEEGVNEAT